MKKFLLINIFAVAMIAGLISCGSEEPPEQTETP